MAHNTTDLIPTSGVSIAPRLRYSIAQLPNDPQASQWYLNTVHAPAAWNVSTGSASSVIAVIDTGFALNHEDLASKWAPGGWDFVHNDNTPLAGQDSPTSSAATHGTETAGLAGAATNNGVGTASVGWQVKVLPLQALDDTGSGWTDDVTAAVNYAAAHGANVISMSLGSTSPDSLLQQAIDNAIAQGITVVAAAGNCGDASYVFNGCSTQGQMLYPANYPEVIAVGASTSSDTRASFSSTGPNLALLAPGSGTMVSTAWSSSNQTSLYSSSLAGTSFATPIVASAAALLHSFSPNLTPAQIKTQLENSADKIAEMNGAMRTNTDGYGRLNTAAMLNQYRSAGSWNTEVLDGAGSALHPTSDILGGTPNAVSFGSTLNSFYYDNTIQALRWAYQDSNGWHYAVLDGAGGVTGSENAKVGLYAKGFVYNSVLHVFYYDLQNGTLRHAWTSDDTNWNFETLDGAGGSNGRITANVGGQPTVASFGGLMQLFYYDNTHGSLRHASYNPSANSWGFETLDGTGGLSGNSSNVGQTPVAVSFGSTLQIFYYDTTYGNLRHAWYNGSSWSFENLDGDPGSIAGSNANLGIAATATVFNSSLQLFYYDIDHGNLRHAWADATGWHFENLDGDPGSIGAYNAAVGLNPSVTVYNNNLQLFYYDATAQHLRHAWTDSAGWHFENLDGPPPSLGDTEADMGYYSAATVDNSTLELFYTNASVGELQHAWPQ